jgi:uncharacterized protein (DUF362 family)
MSGADEEHEVVSRRTFIGRAAVAGAVFAGAAAVGLKVRDATTPDLWDADAFPPLGSARVAVVPQPTYDGDLVRPVQAGLEAIGADVRGARVVLKPNFVEFDAGSAINTDPRLVAATVEAMRHMGAVSVTVGEGPGHRRDASYVAHASGLIAMLDDVRAPFVDLNTASARPVSLHSHYTPLGELWLPSLLTDADVVVSMPKMKTHHWAGVTLSLKNLFGCLPGRVYGWPKNALHWVGIDNAIVDIAGAVMPSYSIVDGIVAMEGNGPISGTPKHAGLLVFGDDPVATDTVTATMMGMDPSRIPYLREAARFLGVGDLEQIEQRGADPGRFMMSFEPAPGAEGLQTATGGN